MPLEEKIEAQKDKLLMEEEDDPSVSESDTEEPIQPPSPPKPKRKKTPKQKEGKSSSKPRKRKSTLPKSKKSEENDEPKPKKKKKKDAPPNVNGNKAVSKPSTGWGIDFKRILEQAANVGLTAITLMAVSNQLSNPTLIENLKQNKQNVREAGQEMDEK